MAERSIGIIGLGKMGSNIAKQLIGKGYNITVYNRSKEPVKELVAIGATGADSIKEFVAMLAQPRSIWLMLPAGQATTSVITELAGLLDNEDVVVDGSNSYYKDDIEHKSLLENRGVHLLDAGCSGGPSGALNGMSIMVGGEWNVFEKLKGLFKDLSVRDGFSYIGGTGSGHFVKMVHNAIEYGMMESIAEGLELVKKGPYKDLDIASILKVWNNGSVISGRLMELSERAIRNNKDMSGILPHVDDTGEGRWSSMLALEYGIPFISISNALDNRFSSRDDEQYGRRFLAALRHEFGGHRVEKVE
jgi:6-phosphogluconate dehydrogenase